MLNCKKAHEVASKGLDRELSMPERIGLKLHLLMCRLCRRAHGRMMLIRRLARWMGSEEADTILVESGAVGEKLPTEAKTRIKKALSRGV